MSIEHLEKENGNHRTKKPRKGLEIEVYNGPNQHKMIFIL